LLHDVLLLAVALRIIEGAGRVAGRKVNMQNALILFVSFCFSALFVGWLIPVGNRCGLIDVPSGHRAHQGATPLVGGIAMYCAIVLSSELLDSIYGFGFSAALLAACGLLVLMGVLDDRHQLSVRIRLMVQMSAAFLVIYCDDVVVRSLGPLLNGEDLDLGVFAVPFTVFAIVGAVNAMNMMDGLDGLAGMVALAVFLSMAVLAAIAGLTQLFSLLLSLIGITAGFLLYNFQFNTNKSASVFMGDAGSTLLGFLIAVLLVGLSQNGADLFSPVTALWLFALPLYDTLGVMARRVWLKQSPFKADRNHLHHILLDVGFRVRSVVLILFTLQVGFALIGLGGSMAGIPDAFMLYLFLAGWFAYLYLFISPWRLIPRLQGLHDQISSAKRHFRRVFIGNLPVKHADALTTVCELLGDHIASTFHLFIKTDRTGRTISCYCVVRVQSDFERLLNYLQGRNDGVLVIREHKHRQGRKWLPFLKRRLSGLIRGNWHGRARRRSKTYLIYSSIRDSKHIDHFGRSQQPSSQNKLPAL
jgi:UDP-GlcNAc:undecaprenyl-phosphate/decaprenyl-phosphate GlcNAc-1-phosphate transferase